MSRKRWDPRDLPPKFPRRIDRFLRELEAMGGSELVAEVRGSRALQKFGDWLPEFFEGYLFAAIWTTRDAETDEPLKWHTPRLTAEDFAPRAKLGLFLDAFEFLEEVHQNVPKDLVWWAGADFWLARQGKGDFSHDWDPDTAEKLWELAADYSPLDLCVKGGKVHVC